MFTTVKNEQLSSDHYLAYLNVDYDQEKVFVSHKPIAKSVGRFFPVDAGWHQKTLDHLCGFVVIALNDGHSWEYISHSIQPLLDRIGGTHAHLRTWVFRCRRDYLRQINICDGEEFSSSVLRHAFERASVFWTRKEQISTYKLRPYFGWEADLDCMLKLR